MSLGRQPEQQGRMWMAYDELPKGMGHAFYDHLQKVLCRGGFDDFAEKLCAEYYALMSGRPSISPGRYLRMLFVGYFEGIDSERGICWRCVDSLSLREFLRLDTSQKVPDHSSLCRIRQRLPIEAHHEVFSFVLQLLAKKGLIKGKKLGIDASTMEASAALKTIVRRDTGEGYSAMLQRLVKESSIATPTKEDLIRFDRKRKDKTLSNKDWKSPVDGDSRIAKLKDGRIHLAYKPEHVVDLDSGAIVSAKIHQADQGDTTIMHKTLADARTKLKGVLGKKAPKYDKPAKLAADEGYHSHTALVQLDSAFRSRISEPERKGIALWRGDFDARRAVYNNRSRLQSAKGKSLQRLRSERMERSFAHCLDRGGMRRAHLLGSNNIEKRYILHVAGFNLGLLMRSLFGVGTLKGRADTLAMLVLTCFEGRLVLWLLFCQSQTPEQSGVIAIYW